jgi:hypothetical protein
MAGNGILRDLKSLGASHCTGSIPVPGISNINYFRLIPVRSLVHKFGGV